MCNASFTSGQFRNRPQDKNSSEAVCLGCAGNPSRGPGKITQEEKVVDKDHAIKPATLVGEWRIIPGETLRNDAEHTCHKYSAQEGKDLR